MDAKNELKDDIYCGDKDFSQYGSMRLMENEDHS